jgi:hypothetical protein
MQVKHQMVKGGIMKLLSHLSICLIAGMLLVTLWFGACLAEEGDMKIDPKVCAGLQAQVDEMVKLSKSSLSQDEKMKRLKQVWDKSWSRALSEAEDDTETLKMLEGMGGLVAQLLASISAAEKNGETEAPDSTMKLFGDLKQQTKTFVGLMMMLCPDLKLPSTLKK